MIDAGQVVIKLIADTNEYKTQIQTAGNMTEKAMTSINKGINAVGYAVKALIASKAIEYMVDFADQASRFDNLTKSFDNYASTVTGGSAAMMSALKKASGGMINQTDLMKAYNKAAQLVSKDFAQTLPDALGLLQKVAASTGTDLNYLIDSFVVGIGRQSKLILDNMGITTDAELANENYARSIGKATSELTAQERQLALAAQVTELLQRNTAGMVNTSDTVAGSIARIKATWDNMVMSLGVALLPTFEKAFSGVETYLSGIISAIDKIKLGFSLQAGTEVETRSFRDMPGQIEYIPKAGIDDSVVQNAKEFAGYLSDALNSIQKIGDMIPNISTGFSGWDSTLRDVSIFIDEIAKSAEAIALILSGDFTGGMAKFGEAADLEKQIFSAEIVPGGFMDNFVTGANNAGQAVNDFFGKLLNGQSFINDIFLPAATGLGVGFTTLGGNIGTANTGLLNLFGPETTSSISTGTETIVGATGIMGANVLTNMQTMNADIGTQSDLITKLFGQKASGWVSVVRGYVGQFQSVGAALMQGLANGIIQKAKEVISAVVAAIKRVVAAAKAAAGIASPSKVFAEIGNQLMAGMAVGIDKGSGMAVDSVTNAMNGVSSSAQGEAQNAAILSRLEDLNNRLDRLPNAFKEAVMLIA